MGSFALALHAGNGAISTKSGENSTLRYECDERSSDECEFAAWAEGEWCNHTCQENVFSDEYRTKFYITRCENADFRTRSVRKTAFTHAEWYKIYILYAFWRSDIATKCRSPITACELSATRWPNLSGMCFIDDREILVQGLPLRCRANQLVPQKSRALYISLLISIVPETVFLSSYGVEFLVIVW